jgi:hypothetical protein
MVELKWILNEITGENHLYYRELPGKPPQIYWQRVPTQIIEKAPTKRDD